jgi:hypothetical protein
MKITPSVIVASMSGAAGSVVASTWKGRGYVRKLVIPKNPNTADQIIYRDRFARMPGWFRSLPAALRSIHEVAAEDVPASWQAMADADQLSIFNEFSKANLVALKASLTPPLMRGNPDLNSVGTPAAVAGGSSKTIAFTWVQGSAPAGTYVLPLTIPVDPDEADKVEPDVITAHAPVAVATQTATLTVATAAKSYYVIGVVIDAATVANSLNASGGAACTGLSKA